MPSLPKLIPTDERTRRLVALVRAAQTTLAGLEHPIARVWSDSKDTGEYHECLDPRHAVGQLLGVVDVDALANILRDALKDYEEIPVKFQSSYQVEPPASTALAHLSAKQPPAIKQHDTVKLLVADNYRGVKAGEVGKVTNVVSCGRWVDVRWRNKPAHDMLTRVSHVEVIARA